MTIGRRSLIVAGATAIGSATASAQAVSSAPAIGWMSASQFGLRPGAPDDQSISLQRGIDRAASLHRPLFLEPGVYRVSNINLPNEAKLVGVEGASRLVVSGAGPLVTGRRCDGITLRGLVLDGMNRTLKSGLGTLMLETSRRVAIEDCQILNSGGNGIQLEAVQGRVSNCTVSGSLKSGIFSLNAAGLRIADNVVEQCGNNGIQVWRSDPGPDGTFVLGNRIVKIASRDGGSGQNGNAINIFRAQGVIIANNHVHDCAFSAVRANRASNIQIIGNNCSALGEVALYIEFGYEGAVVANNIVDGASIGLSMTNFNEGGRLAVAQGNVFRNLHLQPAPGTNPDGGWGVGIHAEADTAITGNVVENVANFGISLGWAQYLRNVAATNNIVRSAPVGIAVSVTPGAGAALITGNLFAGAIKGAVVGFDRKRIVTGDLSRESRAAYPQLTISGNASV